MAKCHKLLITQIITFLIKGSDSNIAKIDETTFGENSNLFNSFLEEVLNLKIQK